jgi:hypothetical protein
VARRHEPTPSGTASVGTAAGLLIQAAVGIDRLFDGFIGAAIGLVIVAVFARSSVYDPAVAVTGTGARGAASERLQKEGARP